MMKKLDYVNLPGIVRFIDEQKYSNKFFVVRLMINRIVLKHRIILLMNNSMKLDMILPMRSINLILIPKKFTINLMINISMEKLQVRSNDHLQFSTFSSLDFADNSAKARGYVQHGIYQNVSNH